MIALKAHSHQLLMLWLGQGECKVDPSAVAYLGKAIDVANLFVELKQKEVSRSGNC